MRLERIKLAGFKSFVDPTTVRFPSNLVGVVGPNGCGKSNVIDAVRWVMGESSAKMLRGESMADVIFNGSTGRQPVGLASIELVFDNADGGAGGAYAAFNQISVKRQVGRDGQSSYFLNGTRCRRRDIQDLFLGTGLGPRSYAIIEQGMISRIIEARPEDLRLFLEEAAGISKYKERRRETEGRMRQTRENLDRLEDLRDEVGKQLQHLERQAASAERYAELKAEESRLDVQLKALRWRALDDEIRSRERHLAEVENEQEAGLSRQRRLEAEIETKRDAYQAASESFNAVQGRFYAVGAEIARAEQAIQFANEARGRREGELVRLDQEIGEADDQLQRDQGQLSEIDRTLLRDEPALVEADRVLSDALEEVARAESCLKDWEQRWDDFSREAAAPAEQAQAERARINALERRGSVDRERLSRLDEELARLEALDLEERFHRLVEREGRLAETLTELQERGEHLSGALAEQDAALGELAADVDRTRTELHTARGRLASLSALQDEALAQTDAARVDWLAGRALADAPRLLDGLAVEPGWERAVEVVLGDALGAIAVPDLAGLVGDAQEPPAGLVLVEDARPEGGSASRETSPGPDGLLARARAPWGLDGWLGGVRTLDSLAGAVAARDRLGPDESWVTPRGARVGRNWLSIPRARTADGAIARAEAIKALGTAIAGLETAERERSDERRERLERRGRLSEEGAELARTLAALAREVAELRAELAGLEARRENRRERLEALRAERAELGEHMADAVSEMEEARERLHAQLAAADALAGERERLQREREDLRARAGRARDDERRGRERTQGLRVSVESNRAAREATRQGLARLQERRAMLHDRRAELLDALEEGIVPLAEQRARLDEQLILRVEVEQALTGARARLEALDGEIRAREQERLRIEQAGRSGRDTLDRLRLELGEQRVRRQTLAEQIAELDRTPSEVLAAMPPDAEASLWQESLAKTSARLQRLGPVNLAAVDEYRRQAERKAYLDTQHDDISRSLETLEQAIRKIDRETRSRFRDTYDRVNQGFQQLFPRLFGGGHASLELTDNDLLETGVSVTARPPGKRNSSIHLLSGGEKALTAVALVFAIFELNPAPFCLLDEVDAPLDDANVGRFCELVRSMSDRVQFVFISHNKVTMEIADHLVGVTMHEPGVSRLVSVDVEEAVRLAEMS